MIDNFLMFFFLTICASLFFNRWMSVKVSKIAHIILVCILIIFFQHKGFLLGNSNNTVFFKATAILSILFFMSSERLDSREITIVTLLPFIFSKTFLNSNILFINLIFFLMSFLSVSSDKNKIFYQSKKEIVFYFLWLGFLFSYLFSTQSIYVNTPLVVNEGLYIFSFSFLLALLVTMNGFLFFPLFSKELNLLDVKGIAWELMFYFFFKNIMIIKIFILMKSNVDENIINSTKNISYILFISSFIYHLIRTVSVKKIDSTISSVISIILNITVLYVIHFDKVLNFIISQIFLTLVSLIAIKLVQDNYDNKNLVLEKNFKGLFYIDKTSTVVLIIALLSFLNFPGVSTFFELYNYLSKTSSIDFSYLDTLLYFSPIIVLVFVYQIFFGPFYKNDQVNTIFYSKMDIEKKVLSGFICFILLLYSFI